MIIRGRMLCVIATLTVVLLLCSCSSTAPRSSTAKVGPSNSSRPSSTVLRTSSSAGSSPGNSTGACSNLTVVSTWPVARRAAQLVVAPTLNFDMSTVQIAASSGVGGILFLGDEAPPTNLATQLQTAFASPGPGTAPLVMADEEGGGVQRLQPAVPSLPWARDMAQTMSPAQVEAQAAAAGRSMRQLDVDVDLAPVLDLDGGSGPSATDADGSRSFSTVPSITSQYGIAFMQGLQSAGVLPVLKHFPGLGEASGNTDYGAAATQPIATLDAAGLQPFQAAIAAGAPAVMISNATVPGLTGLPASLSSNAIDGLLRHTLGFDGLVLTDSLSAAAISQAGYDLPDASVAAIEAGADMVLFGSTLKSEQTLLLSPQSVSESVNQIIDAIVSATNTGSLPVDRLDDAVEHVMAAKGANLCAN